MENFLELLNVICFVIVIFVSARFGWVMGFYSYHTMNDLLNSLVSVVVNVFKSGGKNG